jgi:uncharacterized caspase-like protein
MNMQLASAHALVVGITQYQHVRPLPQVADAEDLASVLRDPSACGYPAANVALLREAEASRARTLDALDELARRASADSTVLIYFSGHGGQPVDGGDSYLMPVDGAWARRTSWKPPPSPVASSATRWRRSRPPGWS